MLIFITPRPRERYYLHGAARERADTFLTAVATVAGDCYETLALHSVAYLL